VSHPRLDLLIPKQIGDRTVALRVAYPLGGACMAAIGRPTKARKAHDGLQARGALGGGTCQPSPRHGRLRHDMRLTLGRGTPDETGARQCSVLQFEATRTADGQRGINGVFSPDAAPGHGMVTCWNTPTSTWASWAVVSTD
jgi:hypothetical protein